jgi:hypothetical protein
MSSSVCLSSSRVAGFIYIAPLRRRSSEPQ